MSSFGSITNSKQPCQDVQYKKVKARRTVVITDGVYNPTPVAVNPVMNFLYKVGQTDTYVNYWYMKPIDVLGPSRALYFNRMSIFVRTPTPKEVNIKVALYKLTNGATIGDASTYKNNSYKVIESEVATTSASAAYTQQIDLKFNDDVLIRAYDDDENENHYFLAILDDAGAEQNIAYGLTSSILFKDESYIMPIINYAFKTDVPAITNPLTFDDTIGRPFTYIVDTDSPDEQIGNFLYYTLWKV
jgi:hypothetical protein